MTEMGVVVDLHDNDDDDDKNVKSAQAAIEHAGGFGCFSLRSGMCRKDIGGVVQNPYRAYTCLLAGLYVLYHFVGGGSILRSAKEDHLGFLSCVAEAYGLISLLYKINLRGHVNGISGMSVIMFAVTYTCRLVETFLLASKPWVNIDGMALEFLQTVNLCLVYTVLWSIFKTYRNSYQADLDVLKVKYLLPGCVMLAAVLHPRFRQGLMYSLSWTASFYVDVLALLPQVVMTHRGKGKLEVPIANFVMATAISRSSDLVFWCFRRNLGPQGFIYGINVSGIIIISFHLMNLALVADFMYYYIKARLASSSATGTITIEEMS